MKFVLPIVGLHLMLAVYLGALLNIWADESSSLETTRGTLAAAINQAVKFEWQPPAYFFLLWIWRQIHPSIVWARILSAICTASSIFIFYFFSRRVALKQAKWPYWATIVMALHPYTIFAATELRLYAMGLFLSMVQLDWFWRGYVDERKTWRWWYFAVATLSLYVNVLLGLTLAAQNAALWCSGRWKEARHHSCGLIVVGIVYLPMFLLQLSSLENKDVPGIDTSIAKAVSFVIGSVSYNWGPLPRIESTLALRLGLTVALAVFFVWNVALNWRHIDTRQWFAWSYLLAVSCLLMVFLVVTNLRPNPRYTYPLLAASLLAWGQFTELFQKKVMVIAIWFATLGLCLGTLAYTYLPLCKTGDWVRVTRFLESHEDDNQPIVVFISEVDTILRNYYHNRNVVVPVPGPQRMDRFLFADFDIRDKQTVRELLDPVLKDVNECWLVTNEGGIRDDPHRFHQEYLDAYLQEDFSVVECTEFFESKVCRLQRK